VKLVRDEIPLIIEKSGKTCEYHFADYDEYKTRLYEKMREELDEFINTPCYEEAADMWEVFLSICELHELNMLRVEFAAKDKRKERGGFKDRIILETVNESR
jgi:predicted house-cleaning noncanonical NTP pyrophosphatase (MazG superfamily)